MELYPQMTFPESFNNPDASYRDMLKLRDVRYNRKVEEQKQMEAEMKNDAGNLGGGNDKGKFNFQNNGPSMGQ